MQLQSAMSSSEYFCIVLLAANGSHRTCFVYLFVYLVSITATRSKLHGLPDGFSLGRELTSRADMDESWHLASNCEVCPPLLPGLFHWNGNKFLCHISTVPKGHSGLKKYNFFLNFYWGTVLIKVLGSMSLLDRSQSKCD